MRIRHMTPHDRDSASDLYALCFGAAPSLRHRCIVVVEDDTVSGLITYRRGYPHGGHILHLAVHPDHRRRGVATTMIAAVCREVGGEVLVDCACDNVGARSMYAQICRRVWEDEGGLHYVI